MNEPNSGDTPPANPPPPPPPPVPEPAEASVPVPTPPLEPAPVEEPPEDLVEIPSPDEPPWRPPPETPRHRRPSLLEELRPARSCLMTAGIIVLIPFALLLFLFIVCAVGWG